MHDWLGSSRELHNDRDGPSSNTKLSREVEGASSTLQLNPEDYYKVEKAVFDRRPSDWTVAAKILDSLNFVWDDHGRLTPA
jgi:hypothetical protein